jgi:phosphoribosylglycinamide formyltransferase 2
MHIRAVLGLPLNSIFYGDGASGAYKAKNASTNPKLDIPDSAFTADTFVRVFGKPESHVGRRMAISLALGDNIEDAKKKALEIINQISDS